MAPKSMQFRDRNFLLATLPPQEYERLLPNLRSMSLAEDYVLLEPFKPIRFVFFPSSGAVSLTMPAGPGQQIEAGMVGREGMTGLCLSLGSDQAPMRAVVQTSCHGLSMTVKAFRAEMQRNSPLAAAVRRYAHSYLVMLSQTLVCMRAHRIEQRCARWLLMLHDRLDTDQFRLTHKTLARMLGVRRASVSEVASRLQRQGLVRYERGLMTIVDRAGLENAACDCNRILQRELNRLMATLAPRRRAGYSETADATSA